MGTKILTGGVLGANRGRSYPRSTNPTRYDYSAGTGIVDLTEGTVSFWVKVYLNSDNNNTYNDIFSVYNPTQSSEFTIGLVRTGGIRTIRKYTVNLTAYNQNMIQLFGTDFNSNQNVWFHVAISKGGVCTLNGNSGGSFNDGWFTHVSSNISNPKYLKFGQTDDYSRYPGRLPNLGKTIGVAKPFILNTSISASDMADIYNAGITFDPRKSKWADNLVSFWPMEDNGAGLNDIVGPNNLTASPTSGNYVNF